jgi:hypothetical protein
MFCSIFDYFYNSFILNLLKTSLSYEPYSDEESLSSESDDKSNLAL